MSVEMKLGRWQARDGSVHEIKQHDPERYYPWIGPGDWVAWRDDGQYAALPSNLDLVRYLGPIELSPTPACAEAGPAGSLSTVSTEDPQVKLRRLNKEIDMLRMEGKALMARVRAVAQAESDLEQIVKMLEKEVEG